jgi:hypothetical protein
VDLVSRPRPWEDLREDVEWLLKFGTPPFEICRRVEMTVGGIQAAYRRHGVPVPGPLKGNARERVK